MRSSFSFSPSSILEMGMPVHADATSADLLIGDFVTQQFLLVRLLLGRGGLREATFQLGNLAVRKLRTCGRDPAHAAPFHSVLVRSSSSLSAGGAFARRPFGLPHLFQVGIFLFEPAELLVQRLQALLGRVVGLFLQGLALDLQLDDADVRGDPWPRAWSRSPCGCASRPRRSESMALSGS